MKLYKENNQLIINGENDLTLKKNYGYAINLSNEVTYEKMTICNFHFLAISPTFIKKLGSLYKVIKFIFTK